MRTLRLAIAAATATALLVACDGSSNRDVDNPSPTSSHLIVWTANLEHLLPEHDWTAFVDRIAAGQEPPDLLFLSELTRPETLRVVDKLQDEVGREYAFDHAPVGNNAVAWAKARFGDAATGDPLLWEPYGAKNCTAPSTSDPSQVVGVRLDDPESDGDIVAVAVHWGRTWAAECMEKNMSSLDDVVEERWQKRALTIVAGDLNAHPDKQPVPGEPGVENLGSGRETDPDCWYRSFSALHDQTLDVPRPDEDDRDCADDPHYVASADSYVDAVSATNTPEDLCGEWTSIHGGPVADGTSCTDLNDDGLRDRGRIDYIWLRWEDVDGDAVLPSEEEARTSIGDAAADHVCILDACAETRYSDHRAVRAAFNTDLP